MSHHLERHHLGLYSEVVAARGKISADLSDEAVILDLNSGVYYGLDEVGTRIWELIQEPRRVSEVREALLDEYEVEAARCEAELLTFLADMADQGLIEVRGGVAG